MAIELWLGLECTVNRVGEIYFDQIKRSGHQDRLDDLYELSKIGAGAIRYPILWERTAPDGEPDWRWPDARLNLLRNLGIKPVVGLIHHGSGPRYTDLLDANFPEQFAAYARACAERYPWLEAYIPVNEPLTTARFSALYGRWYPHRADDLSFLRAFFNQCKAALLAVQEIRAVNPHARFVQTEDLGKVFSTRRIRYQADFENERRWLTFDLLCGRLNRHHPLWSYCLWAGIDERELVWFEENACAPDVIGVNHYVTSDRYLDHRVELFPGSAQGSNSRDRYADVEAIRICPLEDLGIGNRIRETWQRYRIPIVVTEAHLGCTNADESIRWLSDVWNAANLERASGADVQGVTAWAAFGAYDWNSLVTHETDYYEPGLFDVRYSPPRATPLADLAQQLAAGISPSHRALNEPGWWKTDNRLFYERELAYDVEDHSLNGRFGLEGSDAASPDCWL